MVRVVLEPEALALLDAFTRLLSESEKSMVLTDRRAWWGARTQLDRQLKVRTQDASEQ